MTQVARALDISLAGLGEAVDSGRWSRDGDKLASVLRRHAGGRVPDICRGRTGLGTALP